MWGWFGGDVTLLGDLKKALEVFKSFSEALEGFKSFEEVLEGYKSIKEV